MKKILLMLLLILVIMGPYEANFDSDIEINNMFEASNGFDGAYAELFSVEVADLYLQNEVRFIKLLGKKPDETLHSVCDHVAYGCSYKNTAIIFKQAEKLLSNKFLTSKEKHIVSEIVEKLKVVEKQ